MTRHQARAARRERQVARALGSRRVVRAIGESAGDVVPSTLPTGAVVQCEVKERAAPLRTVERWLAQCAGYAPSGAVCVLVVCATGERIDDALVVLRLSDFRRVAGLAGPEAPDSQQSLDLGKDTAPRR